jgi:hypothetical protein
MTALQRRRIFDRKFTEMAHDLARRKRLDYVGTIRKLPPPPLPGEKPGTVRYFVSGAAKGGRGILEEFTRPMYRKMRRLEAWELTGNGAPAGVLKRKV